MVKKLHLAEIGGRADKVGVVEFFDRPRRREAASVMRSRTSFVLLNFCRQLIAAAGGWLAWSTDALDLPASFAPQPLSSRISGQQSSAKAL